MSSGSEVKGDKPGFIALLVFAGIAAGIGLWWATSAECGPALGFGALAIAQVMLAIRARRRVRAPHGG